MLILIAYQQYQLRELQQDLEFVANEPAACDGYDSSGKYIALPQGPCVPERSLLVWKRYGRHARWTPVNREEAA